MDRPARAGRGFHDLGQARTVVIIRRSPSCGKGGVMRPYRTARSPFARDEATPTAAKGRVALCA